MSAQIEEFVDRARSGDSDAFGELYKLYYKEMYSYACCMVGDKFAAQDAVSDAVMEAYKSISSLKKTSSFKGWLFRILNISCRHQYKKFRAELQLDESYDVSVSGRIDDTELSMDMQKAMKMLSAEEREIVLLSIVYSEKSHDIAAILDMNASTVRTKLKRALEKLRYQLEDYNEKGGGTDE